MNRLRETIRELRYFFYTFYVMKYAYSYDEAMEWAVLHTLETREWYGRSTEISS